MKKLFLLFLFCFLIIGCNNKPPEIDHFNNQKWKEDKFGCSGNRAEQVGILLSNKESLLGLSNNEIIEYLGKPDQVKLHARNQKFIHYNIGGAEECGQSTGSLSELVLRINATGMVSEITLYN